MKRLVCLVAAVAFAAAGYGQVKEPVLEKMEVQGDRCKDRRTMWTNGALPKDDPEIMFLASYDTFDVGTGEDLNLDARSGFEMSTTCVYKFTVRAEPGYRATIAEAGQHFGVRLSRGVKLKPEFSFSFNNEPAVLNFSEEFAGPLEDEPSVFWETRAADQQVSGPSAIYSDCSGRFVLTMVSKMTLIYLPSDEEPEIDDISMAFKDVDSHILKFEPCK